MNHHYMLIKIAHRDGNASADLLSVAALLRSQAARGDNMSALLLQAVAESL